MILSDSELREEWPLDAMAERNFRPAKGSNQPAWINAHYY